MALDLDQMVIQYREHLRKIQSTLSQLIQSGQCDVMLSKGVEDILERLEDIVACLMDKQVMVEKARQAVLDLRMVLSISRQTVEAKSKHLGLEEKQKEELQNLRFKEFQKIHKLQDEKAAFERELIPLKRRLNQVKAVLDEKNEKIRNLEVEIPRHLTEHCAWDMISLKDKTDEARAERSKWDLPSMDVGRAIREFPLDIGKLKNMEQQVCELKKSLQHHKLWYDEELQTKLFYSTRSKEIKYRITYFKNMLRRLEKSGSSDSAEDDIEERRLSRRSEHILVDGSPGIQAKEVERYLSQQFGMKVLADYTMLRRLKDEIGVQGLAYLVEKIRLQGSCCTSPSPSSDKVNADWEEKRVEQALMNIALEYRDRDEHKKLLRVPGMSSCPDSQRSTSAGSNWAYTPSSSMSAISHTTANTTTPESSVVSGSPGREHSNVSLKRRPSLAKIKKFLKF